ncbi:hypothetical protein [Acinetobacter guerrae]|uniref:hypothetical protein n=1 Tax=Acinetobacter guerrae TaxID=1843371 RepID=UPI00128CD1FC|nr:hypothetical protein [Acinetobacter guerrae]MPW43964.1 hypothetical protein [Acinetobacter guerrae]
MKKTLLLLISGSVIVLSACQSTPRQYNGNTGYQVENKTVSSATLAYTLAGRSNRELDERKLQRACQQVLGTTKTYKLSILSVNEIANPASNQSNHDGLQVGNSRMSVGLMDSPSLNNSEGYATRQALDTKPSTLKVVRYTCS